ncbi:MAG: twin-arginine translocase TatA/TatE family subunit [Firmicutes bacterium]|nr:twin-arginine translocase TatA/TatE family subunit [Bacillota bacterium]
MNLGVVEVLVILLIAFLVIGPKDLPKIARFLAKAVKKIRQFMYDMKAAIDLEEELKDVKDAGKSAKDAAGVVNPMKEIRKAVTEPMEDLKKTMTDLNKDLQKDLKKDVK